MSETTTAANTAGAVAVPSTFIATINIEPLHAHSVSVTGTVRAGYRVKKLTVEKANHAPADTLLLIIHPELGPVENPHSNAIRNLPVTFEEQPPKGDYKRIEIHCEAQRFDVKIEFIA